MCNPRIWAYGSAHKWWGHNEVCFSKSHLNSRPILLDILLIAFDKWILLDKSSAIVEGGWKLKCYFIWVLFVVFRCCARRTIARISWFCPKSLFYSKAQAVYPVLQNRLNDLGLSNSCDSAYKWKQLLVWNHFLLI